MDLPPKPPVTAPAEPTFEQSFHEPAISGTVATGIPGLELLLVYEAHVPADPIIPQRWLETPDGRKFRASSAAAALAHMGWAPRSPEEAQAAARLPALADPAGSQVYGVDDTSLLPAGVAAQVGAAAPRATLVEPGTWEVVQYLFRRNAMPRPHPQLPPSLERQRVTVGKGVLKVRSERVWPEPPAPPPLVPAEPAPPPDDFDQVFKHPVIDWRRPSGIAGVELLSVYDQSWAAEDPLIPQHWLEAGGQKFRPEQAQAALAHLGWAPASPEAALAAARLPLHGDTGGAGVYGVDPCSTLPEAVAAKHQAGPPQVTALGQGRYQVVQVVCRANHTPWPNMNLPVTLERQTVTVGPGLLQVSTKRLWSGPPADPRPSSNLLPR